MNTVEETRRGRLRLLLEKYGSMAELCQALGYARNESSRLTRILNANERKERGQIYQMGSPMARSIEEKLGLDTGYMDTPVSYLDLIGESDQRKKALAVFESIPQDQWATAIRLLDALAKPEKATGTGGK